MIWLILLKFTVAKFATIISMLAKFHKSWSSGLENNYVLVTSCWLKKDNYWKIRRKQSFAAICKRKTAQIENYIFCNMPNSDEKIAPQKTQNQNFQRC